MYSMKCFLLFLYYITYSFIFAGWLFHHSLNPSILRYSTKYFIFLVILFCFFLLPLLIRLYIKRVGTKGFWYSLIPSVIFLCLLYFVFALRYYYTQKHLFDPFLQVPLKTTGDYSTEKTPNTFRILCLGGSTTENLALKEAKRYPNQLRTILKKHYPSVNIEVLNAGRNWYTTKHSLIGYVTYYEDWKPDLVIAMHAINDLARSFSPPDFAVGEYNELWTHFYGPSIRGAKPPTFEEHILSYFEIPINAWYGNFRFKAVDYPLKRYVSRYVFTKNLKKLINYTKDDKTDIILVTQPSLYKKTMTEDEKELLYFGRTICNTRMNFIETRYPSFRSFQRAMAAFNQAIKGVCAAENVICADAADVVQKNIENFRDDVHFTQKGAKVLATSIADTIIDKGLIEKRHN